MAALTPASPKIDVAASVTKAVAAIFTTLNNNRKSTKLRDKKEEKSKHPKTTFQLRYKRKHYVVPISMVVKNLVTSLRSILKTPFSGSFSANSRT